jgi:hypothetical protein
MITHSTTAENAPREAFESAGRRKPATAMALSLATLAVAAGVPAPAYACFIDPSTDKCVAPPPTAHAYQVTGADSQGLAVQALPHIGNVLRWAHNGTTLSVVCQVNNGDQADGRTQYGRPFRTWDQLNDGTFVYDWYMNTPTVATDGYSPGIAHCPTSNPIPPGGGAGTYQVTGTDAAGLAVHSLPQVGGVLRWVPNGTSLTVACQISDGAQVDDRTRSGRPFTTWDQLSDGTWVYDWYMTTPVVGNDGFSPGMPHCAAGSVSALALSPTGIHIGWTDSTGGNATYAVTDGVSVRAAGRGVTAFDWTGLPQDTVVCFEVRSTVNGYTSAWSLPACARTLRELPPCPGVDLHCDATGAFQNSCPDTSKTCDSPVDDYGTVPSIDADADLGSLAIARAAVGDMHLQGWSHAEAFLNQYLSNSGQDLLFSSTDAYNQDGGLQAAVDDTAQHWISQQRPQDVTFDTEYVPFDLATWAGHDWGYAMGHCFYRLVGTRVAGGNWSVSLRLTSYYQFKVGEFVADILPTGAVFRHLEQIGWARNFREIGTGMLTYSASGSAL